MKKIQILGTGCPKCKLLAENAEAAASGLNIEYTIEKITNLNDIISYGVMMTPALVIDGEVKASGKILTIDEIKKLMIEG